MSKKCSKKVQKLSKPRGPESWKKSISLERLKISSFRLKFSISLENFNLAWSFQSWPWEFPTETGFGGWHAWNFQSHLKMSFVSISLENFNPGGRSWYFFKIWALWVCGLRTQFSDIFGTIFAYLVDAFVWWPCPTLARLRGVWEPPTPDPEKAPQKNPKFRKSRESLKLLTNSCALFFKEIPCLLWGDVADLGFRESSASAKKTLPTYFSEQKLNTNFFFSKFSGAAGISRQNPGISRQKHLISLVSRDIPKFLAPTPSHGRPLPKRKISGPKSLGLGSFFVPDEDQRFSWLSNTYLYF